MGKPSELSVNESWGAIWSGRHRIGTRKYCEWIYRFSANPGSAEGRRPAASPGLGTWVGARVASPRCPILRPGAASVPRIRNRGQFTAGSAAGKMGPHPSSGTATIQPRRIPGP
jgi:hypothetical protein